MNGTNHILTLWNIKAHDQAQLRIIHMTNGWADIILQILMKMRSIWLSKGEESAVDHSAPVVWMDITVVQCPTPFTHLKIAPPFLR